jgi:hypothetical protein
MPKPEEPPNMLIGGEKIPDGLFEVLEEMIRAGWTQPEDWEKLLVVARMLRRVAQAVSFEFCPSRGADPVWIIKEATMLEVAALVEHAAGEGFKQMTDWPR